MCAAPGEVLDFGKKDRDTKGGLIGNLDVTAGTEKDGWVGRAEIKKKRKLQKGSRRLRMVL